MANMWNVSSTTLEQLCTHVMLLGSLILRIVPVIASCWVFHIHWSSFQKVLFGRSESFKRSFRCHINGFCTWHEYVQEKLWLYSWQQKYQWSATRFRPIERQHSVHRETLIISILKCIGAVGAGSSHLPDQTILNPVSSSSKNQCQGPQGPPTP